MQEEAECGWRPCKAGMLSPELCSVAWNRREILELVYSLSIPASGIAKARGA